MNNNLNIQRDMSCKFQIKNLDMETLTEVHICFQLDTRLLSDYKHYFTLGSQNYVLVV